MKEISVIAPIFNEETIISEFVAQVSIVLETISSNYEIILVDDGSNDKSWEVIKDKAEKNQNIKAIKLSRNFGHHYAITAGIHQSNSKWTVVMDTDLQDRPEVIKDLYKKANEGYEVVFVSRKNRPEAFWYLFLQKIFYSILNFTSGLKFNSNQANFSIIHFKVVEAFKNFNEKSRFYGSTIKWLGFKTTDIEADHGSRFDGKPSYTLKKRLKLASEIILAFSDRPLKFAIFLSILWTAICILFGGLFLIASLTNNESVNILLAYRIFTISAEGIILSSIGIFGVYLMSIFQEVKKRPLYIISQVIN